MIILASASPRRQELLAGLGLEFEIEPATEEEKAAANLSPGETVMFLAAQKALSVAKKHPDDLVIGADTLVFQGSEALGKPQNPEDAFRMLRLLQGKEHQVYSGLAAAQGDKLVLDYQKTRVFFRELSEAEIRAYIATGEPFGKAGAYAIQGLAALFISGIIGDYFNVVGLPLERLGKLLQNFGLDLLKNTL
ncbi:MAG: Maf family protein [Clostridia bacterium]|nr:Maf family protein [Clostridia bacterium]